MIKPKSLLLHLLWVTVITLCIYNCGDPYAGTGTDTSTKLVAQGVVVADNTTTPVAGVIIGLFPVDFNPIVDTIPSESRDTTGKDGSFSLRSTGNTFNIIARSSDDSLMGMVQHIDSLASETLKNKKVSIKKCGSLSISLPEENVVHGNKAFIPGTPFCENISGKNLVFDRLPEGTYPTIAQHSTTTNIPTLLNTTHAEVHSNCVTNLFTVLLVAGDANLKPENVLIDHIESIGGKVTVMVDDSVDVHRFASFSLIMISGSCESKNLGKKFSDAKVPILVAEPFLYDEMGFTDTQPEVHFGIIDSQESISIINPEHPLALGASKNSTIQSGRALINWGIPKGEVTIVATVVLDPTRATLFCYEKQALLITGDRAPERRVGSFVSGAYDQLNSDGFQLLDDSIFWLLGQL